MFPAILIALAILLHAVIARHETRRVLSRVSRALGIGLGKIAGIAAGIASNNPDNPEREVEAPSLIAKTCDTLYYSLEGDTYVALVLGVEQTGDSPARYQLIAWSTRDGSQRYFSGADPDHCTWSEP